MVHIVLWNLQKSAIWGQPSLTKGAIIYELEMIVP